MAPATVESWGRLVAEIIEVAAHRCLVVASDDPVLRTIGDATDLIGEALGEDAGVVVVPADRLDPSFFELRSGFAGDVLQKAANYRRRFAIVGDVREHVAASNAFRDLVIESTSSQSFFFVADLEALEERLGHIPA
jgi:hypothetical protein